MDFNALSVFSTLAEKLHFGEASQHHHLTPSALSRMIKRLEDELGVLLFYRTKRSVQLTDHGKQVLSFAKQTLSQYAVLKTDLHSDDPQTLKGEIKFYSTVTAAYIFLPKLIASFKKIYPLVTTFLETGSDQNGLQKLKNKDVDFAIGVLTEKNKKLFLSHKIQESPLVFIAQNTFSQEEAENLPMILPEKGDFADLVFEYFMTRNQNPKIHSYVQGNEAILAMVAAGLGSAILPKVVLNSNALKDSVSEFYSPKLPAIEIGVIMNDAAKHSPMKKAFWSFLTS